MNSIYETYTGPSIKAVEPSMSPELYEALERARAQDQTPIYGLSQALTEAAKTLTERHSPPNPSP